MKSYIEIVSLINKLSNNYLMTSVYMRNGIITILKDILDYAKNHNNSTSTSSSEISISVASYDNNSDAVTALGIGKLYKSSTLINGSPIILLTV